ncbi:cytochrome oxidase subunit III [Sphingobium indicum IP26]|uniref:Cytochrome oxidase subunit III n=1 Tax=Sphingobium indicum F2 TaxID=1450518 RepID=A0A8E0WTU5_9SPHN|nr:MULTISPECIES: cytochrome c oxidase subunit 3 [Sphingobium]EPR17350.1 cytochrome oxidase subunit III [Sphingobium indicum IP26]EQA99688.1 cytochrome oxidase subunit III [Sphingobium sp. HDIP04]KER37338.1 cytochrome oxidase subunit III [Sphingobium indicum F2]
MSIITRLTEKSWEPGNPVERERPSAAAVGMVAYFGVALVMFSLLVAAYLMRMGLHEAMGHADDWRPLPDPPLLWINTAVLIASSIAWEVARQRRQVRAALTGTALSLLFLAGQLMLWWHYRTAGYGLSANPANAFFYLLTALHGLHVVGGLVAAGRALARANMRNIALCALYWHFLLAIWLVLAALLLST